VPADSVSIRIYSGIARFPCDSMAFLLDIVIILLGPTIINLRYIMIAGLP